MSVARPRSDYVAFKNLRIAIVRRMSARRRRPNYILSIRAYRAGTNYLQRGPAVELTSLADVANFTAKIYKAFFAAQARR